MKTRKVIYKPSGEQEFKADSLLPCPFCGTEVKMAFGGIVGGFKAVVIKCPECRCEMEATIWGAYSKGYKKCAEELIEKWNRRVCFKEYIG